MPAVDRVLARRQLGSHYDAVRIEALEKISGYVGPEIFSYQVYEYSAEQGPMSSIWRDVVRQFVHYQHPTKATGRLCDEVNDPVDRVPGTPAVRVKVERELRVGPLPSGLR